MKYFVTLLYELLRKWDVFIMNLPNKLTMFRVVLIPVMVVVAYIPFLSYLYLYEKLL